MIGELFNAMVDEVFGDDPETRRNAALPYLFAKHAGYAYGTGAALAAVAAPRPMPAPTPGF
ncbi:MAG: hypothetical protein H6867_00825 [Rhodospirillales bacterium]|nr:hypothetical protein [Rhodospirillales bacterium]MCB9996797.1 hypothetical protein [Rhodospirillales bacterium]